MRVNAFIHEMGDSLCQSCQEFVILCNEGGCPGRRQARFIDSTMAFEY